MSMLWPSLASTDSDLSLGEDKQMTVQLFLHWSNSMLSQLSKQLHNPVSGSGYYLASLLLAINDS